MWSDSSIRRMYLRQTDRSHSRNPVPMSTTDVQDIERLLKENKTWAEITDLKYPGGVPMSIYKAFKRVQAQQATGDTSARKVDEES